MAEYERTKDANESRVGLRQLEGDSRRFEPAGSISEQREQRSALTTQRASTSAAIVDDRVCMPFVTFSHEGAAEPRRLFLPGSPVSFSRHAILPTKTLELIQFFRRFPKSPDVEEKPDLRVILTVPYGDGRQRVESVTASSSACDCSICARMRHQFTECG